VPTIQTILSSDHPSFELIVIDQSPLPDTQEAVEAFRCDARVRYVHDDGVGKGRALNRALELSRGAVLAVTDDDVTVPVNWLTVMDELFEEHPDVAVTFCNVEAAQHDRTAGFVPAYVRRGTVEVTTMLGKCRARGIGAGIAVRRRSLIEMGGFDPLLGPGGPLGNTDDRDLAVRALLAGWHVLETDRVAVVHDGFRTWEQGRALTRSDWFGIGASLSKPIRAGRWSVIVVVLWEGLAIAIVAPAFQTIRMRRFSGLKQGGYFWRGFMAGLRHPINSQTLCFVADAG
jgi:hypothetical protein